MALCRGVPSSLGAILDADAAVTDPERADTAVLYSIWNAEKASPGSARETCWCRARPRRCSTSSGILRRSRPCRRFRASQSGARGTDEPDAKCCARYLVTAGDDGRLLDPVARFHLGNGARLWQLLPGADDSSRGLRRSNGWMVNYRYHPEDKAANRDALERGLPAVGPRVAELLGET
ncbi:MAG: malonyl-CoA decarboxylase family protein [Microthrixaceae bacterium]